MTTGTGEDAKPDAAYNPREIIRAALEKARDELASGIKPCGTDVASMLAGFDKAWDAADAALIENPPPKAR